MIQKSNHIPFNVPCIIGREKDYLSECLALKKFAGDGTFTKRSSTLLKEILQAKHVLLTTSCTDALEMCALLLDISADDEIIMPSFTFVSTANAFVLRGAKIVFVDIDPRTMNIDPIQVEAAITKKTKAIVIVHYAGVSCDMSALLKIRDKYGLPLVEDAAQAHMAMYHGSMLGTLGDLGCFSFHETKNLNCGEGGALVINNPKFAERAEILREKGTNRSRFFRGQTDKYTWVDIGSSFLMGELTAAFLLAQLESASEITRARLKIWNRYQEAFLPLAKSEIIELQTIPDYATPNAHLYYLKLKNESHRAKFIAHLAALEINAVFHYIPLHSSPAGMRFSRFHGEDRFTTSDSERLVRLPIYFSFSAEQQDRVIKASLDFLNAYCE